jgi:hypothetical protein
MGDQPVLLLQTTGRRPGRTRTTPVPYLADGDTFVFVASNAGAACPPGWNLNLHPTSATANGADRYLERATRKAGRDLPLTALIPSTPMAPRTTIERS